MPYTPSNAWISREEIPGTSADKRDSETGGPQAGTTLEGAEYTVRYYDGEYAGDPKEPGREPKYTWIFRTDAEGKIYFSEDWKIGGDPLLLDKETERPWCRWDSDYSGDKSAGRICSG